MKGTGSVASVLTVVCNLFLVHLHLLLVLIIGVFIHVFAHKFVCVFL